VLWPTYRYYISAGGWPYFIGVLFFLMATQGLQIGSAFWLSFWGTVNTRAALNGSPLSTDQNVYYLNMYALISMVGVVGLVARALILAQHRLGTSTALHNNLLGATLGAPVAFFDVTPLGRILNRFSSDMQVVDEDLSQNISQLSNSLFQCLGAVGAIAGATLGTFLVLCVPLVVVYERFQRFFRKSNTAIARLQSVSLSPIYADFSQALAGLNSIRAYGVGADFITRLQRRVDYNSTAFVMTNLASQWLALRLDFLGSLISLFVAVIAVSTASMGFIPAGYLALGLTYSFQLTTYLKFAVRMMASFEASMNAVERQKFYIDNIEQEEDATMKDALVAVPDSWPSEGAIVGTNVQMRYRDGPLVLKGLSFSVKGGEKIGVAGRTGSGKSSLMIALFRIQELAGGTIFIDGVDARTVPLSVLRARLGIIPQDPVIFSASVRFNLDPFDQHRYTPRAPCADSALVFIVNPLSLQRRGAVVGAGVGGHEGARVVAAGQAGRGGGRGRRQFLHGPAPAHVYRPGPAAQAQDPRPGRGAWLPPHDFCLLFFSSYPLTTCRRRRRSTTRRTR